MVRAHRCKRDAYLVEAGTDAIETHVNNGVPRVYAKTRTMLEVETAKCLEYR